MWIFLLHHRLENMPLFLDSTLGWELRASVCANQLFPPLCLQAFQTKAQCKHLQYFPIKDGEQLKLQKALGPLMDFHPFRTSQPSLSMAASPVNY
jgi:hypothetical protein